MASRRDELNAYTFAKRRTLASFLQPSPSGSEEGAPRPLRGFLPGTIMGIVILAVFGAIGMFSPTAPKDWDATGANLIVASDSTTRYVVLETKGPDGKKTKQLHPVLNTASAKLLLKDFTDKVMTVDEGVLDNGDIPHGATLGIPYAPDRLPSAAEAEANHRWMVCERPGAGGQTIQKAAFVLAKKDFAKSEGKNLLTGGQMMYVMEPTSKQQYVVDATGTAYLIKDPENPGVLRALDTRGREPQRVSADWLSTLKKGSDIVMPRITDQIGTTAGALDGPSYAKDDKVGRVLKALDGTHMQHYVVLKGKVGLISEFTAKLLLNNRELGSVNVNSTAGESNLNVVKASAPFAEQGKDWPELTPETVNMGDGAGARDTVCNTLRGMKGSSAQMTTWAGVDFPAKLPTGASSAYVTPGSGQVFRQVSNTDMKSGGVFLVADTGLRYTLQNNADGGKDGQDIGKSKDECKPGQQDEKCAMKLLGYDALTPVPVPRPWSEFVPTGPRLSQSDARQPQGS